MFDKTGMLFIRKKSLKRKQQSVMSSRLEKLPEKDAHAHIWQPDLTSAGCFVCLLGAVAYVIMSTKKKVNAVVKKTSTKRAKKVRSISMSLDLECPGRIPCGSYNYSPQETSHPFKKPARFNKFHTDRNRTVSACNFEQYLAEKSETNTEFDMVRLSTISATAKCESRFPFEMLPADCKLKVFSFLDTRDRGIAAMVCSEWNALMRSSSLWNVVDFTSFPLCDRSGNHECSELCYAVYRQKVKKFFTYMHEVRPVIKRLRFSYDIGDYKDGWLENLTRLLDTARCQDLECAHLNWKESPLKPFYRDSITWSSSDYNELMHRQRHRQRLFVSFFNQFSAAAPNLSKLIVPFDWSPRSLQALCRLQKLETLVLEKYFVFQSLEQDHLDQLFQGLPSLRRAILEVWTPSGRGLMLYSIESRKLEYLDVSQCRGFYLQDVDLPNVKVFKVSRHSWHGPLTSPDGVTVPCILSVLRIGAPKLKQLNEHVLHTGWKEDTYPELETILNAVCSCRLHKTS